MKHTIRDDRPTFYYKDKEDCELRAGGLIPYRFNTESNEYDFLMIKSRGKYEDFGGRTDMRDKCIEDTVAREVEEESNKIIKKGEINKIIKDPSFPEKHKLYTKYSKYIVYLIETKKNYNPKKFGTKEFHDNIYRTVEWVPYSKLIDKEFINKQLHFRLKYKYFLDAVTDLGITTESDEFLTEESIT